MYSKLFQNNFHLEPSPDGAGSGAAAAGSPAGSDAASAAPSFDASAYVPKADFDRISSDYQEFRQTAEQRFQDYDSRLPKPVKEEVKEDVAPKASDYDFNKDGEFERFMDDRARFNFKQEFSSREKQYSETQREQGYKQFIQSTQDAHAERADQFRAANPDYDPNKSIKIGNEAVGLAILESDFSAHIHNFLQKNPEKTVELQKLAVNNPAAAIRMVGRIEAAFETQAAVVPAKQKAAATMTTASGFPSKSSGTRTESNQEIFDRHHK